MSQQYEDDFQAEETGLNLFDDSASVAGAFPKAMWGYDRTSVDSYVREIEIQLSTLKQLTRHLRREMAQVQRSTGDTDLTRLGSHATGILRAAESQGADLVKRAELEAERIKEEGRRVAADLRANAQAEADDIRVAGLANLRKLREDLDGDVTDSLAKARTEAASIVAGALRQAEAITTEATQRAAGIVATAEATAQKAIAEADRTAADRLAEAHRQADEAVHAAQVSADETIRAAQATADQALQTARTSADELLASTSARHDEVTEKTDSLLAEATRHHEESSRLLSEEAEKAQQIRAAALADAEKTKASAAHDAENTIASAHRQAAMMKDRLEEQYAWRKEQLEREVAALLQRKAGMVAAMQNLRELAGETPLDFPDDDPLGTSDPRETGKLSWTPEPLPEPAQRPSTGGATAVEAPRDQGPVEEQTRIERPDEEATAVVGESTTVIDPHQQADPDQTTAVQPAVQDEPTTVIHSGRKN